MELHDELQIEEIRHKNACYRQSNQAAIDFAKMLLRGSFLLNGASVTALLSTGKADFYAAAMLFGWGAALAIVATVASYMHQMLLSETWRSEDGGAYIPYFKGLPLSWKHVEYGRFVPALFVALSFAQFWRGASAVSALIK